MIRYSCFFCRGPFEPADRIEILADSLSVRANTQVHLSVVTIPRSQLTRNVHEKG